MKLFDYKNWDVKKILKETAILVVMIFVVSNVMSYLRKPDLSNSELPQFNAMMLDGKVFNAKEYEGKPLLVHLWATWCPVCKVEAPNIQTLSEHYNVITIAVKSGSDEDVQAFMDEGGYNYKVINNQNGSWGEIYNVAAYPTTFVYSSDGQINFSEVGYTSTVGLFLRMWWAGL